MVESVGGGKKKRENREGNKDVVRISKNLSWVLRHGALELGLAMRSDGFVKVEDLLGLSSI
jgi:RNA:NAD 2'-phosphotransferase (TPT1/KptA family)